MRNLLLVLVLLGCAVWQPLQAQERRVTGTVRDAATGDALPGVTIVVQGTSTGTVTDMNGTYSISVNPTATLVFSFIGYLDQSIPVNNRSVIDVRLKENVEQLSEVVVVGYGVQEKRDATGAVESVKAEDFNQGVISSPEQLIQGKSAGVQITQASGEPGGGVNIRIRGTSSVRAGNNPLFVVDGVPLSGDEVSAGGADLGRGGSSSKNPLNFLNPNDIASIDILKDASATAIYGSRGANGVVLITTKSGKGKKQVVEFGSQVSVSTLANKYDLLNADEFLDNAERLGSDRTALDQGNDTDWQEEITRTALSHKQDLSYSNAYNTGNYRVSLSYQDQEGIVRNSGQERITGRVNWNQGFFNEKLNLGVQGTLSRVNDEAALITNNAGFEGDLVGVSYIANPTWSTDPAIQPDNAVANPNSLLEYYQDNTQTDRMLINLSLGYDITKNINFKVNTGFDNSASVRQAAFSKLLNISGVFDQGRAAITDLETDTRLVEYLLNYNKDFGTSKVSALAGYSYQQFNREGINIQGRLFTATEEEAMLNDLRSASDILQSQIQGGYQTYGYYTAGNGNNYPNGRFFTQSLTPNEAGEFIPTDRELSSVSNQINGVNAVSGSRFISTDELQSYFGRVNYTIADKYLFTATLRADGSTKFGENNRYGYFPSGSAAWRMSEEAFVPDFFTDLKLRLGYGVTGNQEIPHNLHQLRQVFGGLGISAQGIIEPAGLVTASQNNPDLRWEETSQTNLGLDFGLLRGRLSGSFDLYRKVTTDLLIRVTTDQPSPVGFFFTNLDADVINRGAELILNWIAVDGNDFGVNLSVNGSYNHNEITGFGQRFYDTGALNGQGLSGAFVQRFVNGRPLNTFYLPEFIGYNSAGSALYVGEDGNPTEVPENVVYTGKSALPKYNAGFNVNVRYKNFDLAAYTYAQFGHYIYNNTANAFFTTGSLANGRNVIRDVLTSGESRTNAPDPSTRFLEKGDFLRMQNLNLGYTANVGEGFVKGLRVYASAQNLFVLTSYSGLDPEVNVNKAINDYPSAGIDYTSYPRARTYTLGLNVTF